MRQYASENRRKNEQLAPQLKRYMRECGVNVYQCPGKYAETGLAVLLATYVANVPHKAPKEGQKPTDTKRGMIRDYLLGTDMVLSDQPRTMLSRDLLRLDFTIGLTGKRDMPLVTPDRKMNLVDDKCNRGIVELGNGDYMRFGIKIGNGRYGFNGPVLVAGLCSPREMDPQRIRENIEYLHSHVMDSAPEIIRTANLVMTRFKYMTDPAYKAALDERNSPQKLREKLPVLVGNWAYLTQEAPYAAKRAEKGVSRMCRANVANAVGELERNYIGDLLSVNTDVPWMSPMGHAAVEAMTAGPRAIPASSRKSLLATRALILGEQVRDKGVTPPIIVDQHKNRLDDQPYHAALRELAAKLDRQFDPEDEAGASGPSK